MELEEAKKIVELAAKEQLFFAGDMVDLKPKVKDQFSFAQEKVDGKPVGRNHMVPTRDKVEGKLVVIPLPVAKVLMDVCERLEKLEKTVKHLHGDYREL